MPAWATRHSLSPGSWQLPLPQLLPCIWGPQRQRQEPLPVAQATLHPPVRSPAPWGRAKPRGWLGILWGTGRAKVLGGQRWPGQGLGAPAMKSRQKGKKKGSSKERVFGCDLQEQLQRSGQEGKEAAQGRCWVGGMELLRLVQSEGQKQRPGAHGEGAVAWGQHPGG